jgi:gamma-D-glutamyl-L-lysine dipeptidyl-peptidase
MQTFTAEIESVLANMGQRYGDGRRQLFEVSLQPDSQDPYSLTGRVLDQATYGELMGELARRLPAAAVDGSAVQILRQTPAGTLTVSANLTGLYAQPSFQAEMVSQLLDGHQLEQLDEKGQWLFIRLPQGYLGWVYKPYLVASEGVTASHLVTAPICRLRQAPTASAPLSGRLFAGSAVAVTAVTTDWVEIEAAGGQGWAATTAVCPLSSLPQDETTRRQQIVAYAQELIGVPYLWGGLSALGYDCSGMTLNLHRLVGLTIPRDADWQLESGRPVEPPFQPGDLLFFGSSRGHRAVSHVGMSLGGWRIIHSSRPRNGVYIDDVQTTGWLNDIYLGATTYLK